MSTVATKDKETLKLLLPAHYDGKTMQECSQFIAQLKIYWVVNVALLTTKSWGRQGRCDSVMHEN